MGWSFTSAAERALQTMLQDIRARAPQGEISPTSNRYTDGKSHYFLEITHREQPDGGICGSVMKMLPDNRCRSAGTFKVAGDGEIVRWPGTSITDRAIATKQAREPVGFDRRPRMLI